MRPRPAMSLALGACRLALGSHRKVPISFDPRGPMPQKAPPLTMIEPTAAVAAQPIHLVICW